ncbi:manganese catalase family protein [Brevundimonas sp. LF-1]|uniref:manganese catalase family protein n=1 Tax=Brevundimonas sp. LF-1 TaxID=3126100 RepID=UPI0030E327E8
MFMHNKKLMYTVRVAEPNPALATLMLEQFGGPQGGSPPPCATSLRGSPTRTAAVAIC